MPIPPGCLTWQFRMMTPLRPLTLMLPVINLFSITWLSAVTMIEPEGCSVMGGIGVGVVSMCPSFPESSELPVAGWFWAIARAELNNAGSNASPESSTRRFIIIIEPECFISDEYGVCLAGEQFGSSFNLSIQ